VISLSIAFAILTFFVLTARLFARIVVVRAVGPDDSEFILERALDIRKRLTYQVLIVFASVSSMPLFALELELTLHSCFLGLSLSSPSCVSPILSISLTEDQH